MSINDASCQVCGEELNVENYYYISAGRLQQGVMSDPKSYLEYTLCTDCYQKIKAELMVSFQKYKAKAQAQAQEKKEG